MALQHEYTSNLGVTFPEAYTRISRVTLTHGEKLVDVDTWASASARQADKTPLRSQSYSLPWTDSVSLASAYTALKALDEFAGALDV